ncbi:MAG: helix-turn-helix domain-containing protein [Bacteroidales bacterium]|nr:helix-turn-helix domain-containing protein [Bacteroidales bacterium]
MKQFSYLLGGIEILSQSVETQKTNKLWTIVYIKSGAGLYIIEGRLTGLNDGDVVIIPPGLSYSFSMDDLGGEYNENINASVFQFGETWLNGLLSVFRTLGGVALRLKEMKSAMSVKGTKWIRMSSVMMDLKSCPPQYQPLKILELLDLFRTPADIYPITMETAFDGADAAEKMSRIRRYIDCNLLNRITLDEIAAYSGMNRTYFCLFFKKHFGMSLTEYINFERTKKASAMLTGGSMNISDVARESGFPNVTYFNRVFRRNHGMSPTEYRNSKV